MPVFLGPFDPLKLQFATLNALMRKGLLSSAEARAILSESLDSKIPEAEREQILNSLFSNNHGQANGT